MAIEQTTDSNYPLLVSVIVPNWNGRHFLQPCLDSLLAQTMTRHEMIVVDNGSTDGSVELLRTHYAGKIVLIENDRNLGFAKGVNMGIAVAQGDLIALLNNDAIATPRWLEELMRGLAYADRVGMCAPKVLFAHDRTVIDNVGHLLYPDGMNVCRGRGEVDAGQYNAIEETLFPDGSAALYRKAMLDEIGGFDEQFFAFGEDAELGLRGRLSGWTCCYIPTAVVYHIRGGTMNRWSPTKAFLFERNRFWIVVKLFPLPWLIISPLFTIIRWFWQAYSVFAAKGAAGRFARQHSKGKLFFILVKAYASGLYGLPRMLRKRWDVRRRKQLTDREFLALLWRFRANARDVALRDR